MITSYRSRHRAWLVVSLVLILLSAVGASAVQTSGGDVEIKDMSWETSSGRDLSALLFKPDTASEGAPAPAIVVSHGWWNNREMQDANYVELARRGFVVISIDMYGHGNSSPLPNGDFATGGTGMYDAVKLVADLPYVDTDKIGVSGHSNGARAANYSVGLDNASETALISSVFLVDNEAVYKDKDNGDNYFNFYGNRDVGLVADKYDEFFFRTYNAEGEAKTAPRDFLTTANARSFLNFGEEPSTLAGDPQVGHYYTRVIDDKESKRVIYTPSETHPWGTISKTTVASQLDFFEDVFGAPSPLASGNQVWQVKEGFTALGLVGFGIFLVSVTGVALASPRFAASRQPPAPAVRASKRESLWFWGGLAASVVFSGLSYVILSKSETVSGIALNSTPSVFTQGAVYFIGLWAAINGIFTLLILSLAYLAGGRKDGFDLRSSGVLPGIRRFVNGLVLSILVVSLSLMLLFIVDYIFKTDFRWWVVAVKAFDSDMLPLVFLYLPFFLIYYVANSISINSFSRYALFGRDWINTAVLALANSFAPIVLVIVQYATFASTGELVPGFGGIFSIWLIPVIAILFVAAVISRKIYMATGNPYIGGVINALLVTVISVTNTLTVIY